MQIPDFAGTGEMRQFTECPGQDLFVAGPVMRAAERAADRVIDKGAAGRGDVGHDIESCSDHKSWNSVGFDDVRDETDGLVAKRSIWNKECEIRFQSFQFARDQRSDLPFNLIMAAKPAHKGDMERRSGSNRPIIG